MSDILKALIPVVEALEKLGIAYQIGGSVASSVYGVPRTTMDIDLVADLRPEHVRPLVDLLQDRYYLSLEAISEALRRRSSFNLIHLETMVKVDVFILRPEPYEQEAFRRSRRDTVVEESAREFSLSSPEDVILHKLAWFRMGGEASERQWSDVVGVLRVQADALDFAYLQQWATALGLADLLEQAIREATEGDKKWQPN
ncbi:MAG: hypothetical protein D6793_02480 [Thermoflexia bacterium]|nr:MAG: hypothetical protein D6793_02480 [Thermoflexia bacterium]